MPYRQNFPIPAVINPPRCCLTIEIPDHPDWKAVISGLLMQPAYWFNWERTGDTSGAQCAAVWKDVYNSIDWNLMACNGGGNCCVPPAITIHINPTTGLPEQSSDGGTTWTPAAGGLQSVIVEPVPAVDSGVAATKCDAATNLAGQVDVWIAQVETDFDTAITLLEFAVGVLEAILAAVVTILSLGTLTAVEAAVLPLLGAALFAVWGAGKAAFSSYWNVGVKDDILCAAYCTIGDNGAFTDGQFTEFWQRCNNQLPVGPAKMLFLGFLSSVGRQGVNAMAATGMSADADCDDCDCETDCETDNWDILTYSGVPIGSILARGSNWLIVEGSSHPDFGTPWNVMIQTPDNNLCCIPISVEWLTGDHDDENLFGVDCGAARWPGSPTGAFDMGVAELNTVFFRKDAGSNFTAKITFG